MRTYAFSNTIMIIDGVEVTGWSDGDDVIKIARLTDSASHKVGAGGEMMVSLSADRSGTFTCKLQQTSPTNKYLMDKLNLQESGIGSLFTPVSVRFQDTFRNDMAAGAQGYIQKKPDTVRGINGNDYEWTVVVERLNEVLGDNFL